MSRALLLRASAIALPLAVWQLIVTLGVLPTYVLPGPVTVLASLVDGLGDGTLGAAIVTSLRRLLLGYGLSSAAGVLLGIAMGRSKTVAGLCGSLVAGLQPLPSICWMPLALVWFGLNERAILFVVVLATLGTVALAVRDAVLGIPKLWLRAAANMGLSGWSLWWHVVLPAALPGTLTGLRIGWSYAWRALMAGELLFVAGGLGQVMHVGRELGDMARVMATMITIVLLGLAFENLLLASVERRMRRKWGLS
ncbi:MAG: ABC transporter permease [Polyangiaceae bacterium]